MLTQKQLTHMHIKIPTLIVIHSCIYYFTFLLQINIKFFIIYTLECLAWTRMYTRELGLYLYDTRSLLVLEAQVLIFK